MGFRFGEKSLTLALPQKGAPTARTVAILLRVEIRTRQQVTANTVRTTGINRTRTHCAGIKNVLAISCYAQVVWVHTRADSANVVQHHSLRDRAVGVFVREAVCLGQHTLRVKQPVPVVVAIPGPEPATRHRTGCNFHPETPNVAGRIGTGSEVFGGRERTVIEQTQPTVVGIAVNCQSSFAQSGVGERDVQEYDTVSRVSSERTSPNVSGICVVCEMMDAA